MKTIFDIGFRDYLSFFNRISRILYTETTGQGRANIRYLISPVLDYDIDIVKDKIIKEDIIITTQNFIEKYKFYDYEDQDNNGNKKVLREYNVYITQNIEQVKTIRYYNPISSFNDIVEKVYICIDNSIVSEDTTKEEKFKALSKLFRSFMKSHESYFSKSSILADHIEESIAELTGILLIDIEINDVAQEMCEEIISNYIINGVPEVRLNINHAEDILALFDKYYQYKLPDFVK